MKHYLIHYKQIVGELEYGKMNIIQVEDEEDIEEVVDEVFEDWYGDQTQKEFKMGSKVFHDGNWQTAVEITGTEKLPKDHAEILKQYHTLLREVD